jgi:hypothetical protein
MTVRMGTPHYEGVIPILPMFMTGNNDGTPSKLRS